MTKKKKRDKKQQKKAKKLLKKKQKQRIKSLINSQSITEQPTTIEASLVHHIPGRARFRIYRLQDDSDYAANLQEFLLGKHSYNDN